LLDSKVSIDLNAPTKAEQIATAKDILGRSSHENYDLEIKDSINNKEKYHYDKKGRCIKKKKELQNGMQSEYFYKGNQLQKVASTYKNSSNKPRVVEDKNTLNSYIKYQKYIKTKEKGIGIDRENYLFGESDYLNSYYGSSKWSYQNKKLIGTSYKWGDLYSETFEYKYNKKGLIVEEKRQYIEIQKDSYETHYIYEYEFYE